MAGDAIWMNGTCAQAEDEARLALTARRGWGTHFKQAGGSNWFHIPVGQVGLTMSVGVVFVLYRTTNAVITALHVHDGFALVQAFDNQRRSGDRLIPSDPNTSQNAWQITPALFNYGLGLSVQVEFGGGRDVGEILIAAGGAYLNP